MVSISRGPNITKVSEGKILHVKTTTADFTHVSLTSGTPFSGYKKPGFLDWIYRRKWENQVGRLGWSHPTPLQSKQIFKCMTMTGLYCLDVKNFPLLF